MNKQKRDRIAKEYRAHRERKKTDPNYKGMDPWTKNSLFVILKWLLVFVILITTSWIIWKFYTPEYFKKEVYITWNNSIQMLPYFIVGIPTFIFFIIMTSGGQILNIKK